MKRERAVVSGVLVAAMLAAASVAAVPEQINYQGRLVDGTNLVNGPVDLVLSIYDAASDGTLLYADSNTVTAVDGLYATYIGDDTVAGSLTGALATAEAWLEVTVNGVPLSPRERLVAVPYALTAAGVAEGAVTTAMLDDGAVTTDKLEDGAVATAKLATNAVGSVQIADGSVSADDVDATSFATTFWRADGNTGTTPGTHYLGTSDNTPLELRANHLRVLRFEPSDRLDAYSDSPNVIAGHPTNSVTAGACGGTIAGGGSYGGAWNRVTDDFGTIGGGRNNQAGDGASTISNAWFATVGGGRGNTASGPESIVAGGKNNLATGEFAVVSGGTENLAGGQASAVAGGMNNQALGTGSSVLGGSSNIASGNYSVVGGGVDNTSESFRSFIGGGTGNQTLTNGYLPGYSVIGGGYSNQVHSENSFVGGGYKNKAMGFRSAIGGGEQNETHAWHGFIGGGDGNKVYTNYSGIVCGYNNICSNTYSFVGGGYNNYALGVYSAILGGRGNTAEGNYSVAGGFQAAATHVGEFAHASGYFSERGDAQSSEYILRGTSTLVPLVTLYLNGDSGSSPITLASNRVVAFEALITAAADNGEAAVYKYSGGIKRIGENPVQLIGAVSEDLVREDNALWHVFIDAYTNNNSLRFRVTGDGITTRWVAAVRTTETVIP